MSDEKNLRRPKPIEPIEPLILDNLRPGAEVISSDLKDVGKLHAVVIDPRDDQITHIVVNAGPHFPMPGFGAPRLVSVPIEVMSDAREEKIILTCTARKFKEMPDYSTWSFTGPPAEWQAPEGVKRDVAVMGIEALQRTGWSMPVPYQERHREKFEREIPDQSSVWRIEPHSYIGDLERVLIDEVTDEVKALVIRRGHFFGKDVILPIEYVVEVHDLVIRVKISDAEVETLEEFEAPPEP